MVLRWKEKIAHGAWESMACFLAERYSLFRVPDFTILPSPNPRLNPKNAIVKTDFCPSFPRGDNPIILSFSTPPPHLHPPHPHTTVYFLTFINGGWAAILSRLFIVEKIYNSLDFSFWCRSFHPCRLGEVRLWEVLFAFQKCVFRLPFGALSLPSSDHLRHFWQSFLRHLGLGTEFIYLIQQGLWVPDSHCSCPNSEKGLSTLSL